jgi:hypothetical protein
LIARGVASRWWLVSAAFMVVACCLVGCSSIEDQINSSVQQSYSAVQSARLVLRLTVGGKSTTAVTSTALENALTELDSADSTVTSVQAEGRSAESRQKQSLNAIRRSIDAVSTAQRALSGGGAVDDAYAGLNSAAKALKQAAAATGKPVAGADRQ